MSGLSASMWTGVSGLQSHSKNMNVIGNNLANVSTLGFKSQRMDFNDYLYLSGSSASGPTQIGAGSSVYAVLGDFSQGAFETTNSATDLAIDGNGFFGVRKANSEQIFYTRAGDFYFNEDRELVNPQGMRLQGWAVDNTSKNALSFKPDDAAAGISDGSKVESAFVGKGSPTDIILDSWNCIPQRTSSVKNIVGLVDDVATFDKSSMAATANATLGLFSRWDGSDPQNIEPLADTASAYQSTIAVYDEGGKTHDLTIYYDQVNSESIANLPAGYKAYEYIVTMNPEEDMRTGFEGTKAAGMLMTGVLIFDASGKMVNQSAYTYNGKAVMNGTDINLGAWSPTKFSSNGFPTFTANWNGVPGADHVWDDDGNATNPNSTAQQNIIELDLGLKTGGDWIIDTTTTKPNNGDEITPPTATLSDDPADYKTMALMVDPVVQADATACNQSNSIVEQYRSQNGYGSGILSSYSIDENGVVYGVYDNNQTLALYQITMYDFHNYQGLRREGGNLYSQSADSGEPRIGAAGDNGFGETMAFNIENSNVDMTTELVRMITCQRGFQSNSKIITTVDTMLETVIGMKR
ncbi:flagellar hook protein FlgE [uncultured Desulfovibrio sp.]|uniref:flagellar hook protein FlgE n=1 Tax=uncultured Desulfovibrio sp. TaxID=167968 RepID=UPI0026025027|nr:flagellar hook protein FlgE [uncultured Desulfovibrio sp.]